MKKINPEAEMLLLAFHAGKKLRHHSWEKHEYIKKLDEKKLIYSSGHIIGNGIHLENFKREPHNWSIIDESSKIKWLI